MPPSATASPPAAPSPVRAADICLDALNLTELIALSDAVETRLAELEHERGDVPAWQLLLLRERLADADRHPGDSVSADQFIAELKEKYHAASR